MKNLRLFHHWLPNALLWGVSGALLCMVFYSFRLRTNITEIFMMVVFGVCLIAANVTLNQKANNSYFAFFGTSLLTFMLMPALMHLYLFLTNLQTYRLNLIGPFFIMLAIGIPISLALAFLANRNRLKTP